MKLQYEGKTKKVLLDEETGEHWLFFKDTATGEDGNFDPGSNTVGGSVEGKGNVGLRISKYFFELLDEKGVPTHYLGANVDENLMKVRNLTVPPLEFVLRYYAAGSMCRRFDIEEGLPFDPPYTEVTLKSDEQGDPLITDRLCQIKGLLKPGMYDKCLQILVDLGATVRDELATMGLTLVDFKAEMGYDEDGNIYIVDEITPDIWRCWDEDGKISDQITAGKQLLERIEAKQA